MTVHAVLTSPQEGELLDTRTSSVPAPQQLIQHRGNEVPNKAFWGG